jgi:hypothetical protein
MSYNKSTSNIFVKKMKLKAVLAKEEIKTAEREVFQVLSSCRRRGKTINIISECGVRVIEEK